MTQSYYRQHAASYAEATAKLLPLDSLERFVGFLPPAAAILDAGCGCGRDSAWFLNLGYQVDAFDLCPELVADAQRRFAVPARVASILDLAVNAEFDGVWACASLVHFDRDELLCALRNLNRALKPGGLLFLSVKEGQGAGHDSLGRFFRYWTDPELRSILLEAAPDHVITDIRTTRPSFDQQGAGFLNIISRKSK